MAAFEIINNDGTIYIQVDAETRLGPYSSRTDALRALMPIIQERLQAVDAGLQRLIALEESIPGRRRTILPPEGT